MPENVRPGVNSILTCFERTRMYPRMDTISSAIRTIICTYIIPLPPLHHSIGGDPQSGYLISHHPVCKDKKIVFNRFLKNLGSTGLPRLTLWFTILLQAFFNSDSHGNGHTDHRVVACAQEAHHLNVKSACRRLFACGAGAFWAGSPTFRKTRSTSLESGILCFPSTGTSYHIMCSRNKTFELSWTSHHHLPSTTINVHHRISKCLSSRKKLFEKRRKKI